MASRRIPPASEHEADERAAMKRSADRMRARLAAAVTGDLETSQRLRAAALTEDERVRGGVAS